MTRKDLVQKMEEAYANGCIRAKRLYSCKAWWYMDTNNGVVALASYNTLVAVLWRGIVWEVGHYSNTTTSHVRKFVHLYGAPVVSLYRTSKMSKRDYTAHMSCDWMDVIAAATEGL